MKGVKLQKKTFEISDYFWSHFGHTQKTPNVSTNRFRTKLSLG